MKAVKVHIDPTLRDVAAQLATTAGVRITEDAGNIVLSADAFRSMPVFIARGNDDVLYVTSDIQSLTQNSAVDSSVDETGFWETVLFGNGIGTRTLFRSIQQLPAATGVSISKSGGELRFRKNWNYAVAEDGSIDSIDIAADRLIARLDVVFGRLDPGAYYTLGLSGGLDSRLTLGMLSRHVVPKQVKLFTYGFDSRILEYAYACEVAKRLGFELPSFHRLTEQSYQKALETLPPMSGGAIGIQHCHALDYILSTGECDGRIYLSPFYTDALFGYATLAEKQREAKPDSFSRYVNASYKLSSSVKDEILADERAMFEQFDPEANISGPDEFKYIAERNPKFHVYLGWIYSRHVPTKMPFLDRELLEFMLSVPLKFRHRKRIVDVALERHFPALNRVGYVSSVHDYRTKLAAAHFRFLNVANAGWRLATRGKWQLFNKYQTEEQERVLRRDFQNMLRDATQLLVDRSIISAQQKSLLDRIPLRSAGTSERFGLISLAKLVRGVP